MRHAKPLVLIISILASIVVLLDSNVVSIAMPAIVRDLGGGLALQQWVNDAYLITLGTLILAAGSLSDIFGRKRILQYGLVGFLVTSLLCAAAPNGLILSIMRALQGIAGALIVPSSLAIIISTFKGPAQAKAIGQWTAWTGISFILGPLIGGSLVSLAGWRFVFIVNVVPIMVALLLLARVTITELSGPRARLDRLGILYGALGLAGVVYALIEQNTYGLTSPLIYGPFAAGVGLLLGFFIHERRVSQPMVPPALFTVRNFSVGNLATFFIYAALSLQGFVLVIFLQQTAHYSPTFAGLAALPISILMFALSGRFGALAGRFGPRLFMGIGPIIAGIGTLLLLKTDASADYWLRILPAVALFGLGLSMTVAPLTSAILGSISGAQAGIGSAINNAVARIAGLISVAGLGLVTSRLDLSGFHKSIVLCSALLFVGGIVSLIGIQNPARLSKNTSVK